MEGEECNQCKNETTSLYWCQPCNFPHFLRESERWNSGNDDIDELIREAQFTATSRHKILEWIPYAKFKNVLYRAEGGFGKVYSAEWIDGYIIHWNATDDRWKRRGVMKVILKCLNDPQNITKEFLNERKNFLNSKDYHITKCYGITRHDETNDIMIVMQFMEDGSLRNNLSTFRKMSWKDKLIGLSRIADGLYEIHEAELIHGDFHSGNVLLSSIRDNGLHITDFGLCKPVKEFSGNQKKVYGVLPYVAPEVLLGGEYTEAADVYAFGVIMSEVLSGIPPFSDTPHDKNLLTRICNNERPKIQENTPSLIIELMQKCWDAKPSNRMNSYELRAILRVWRRYDNWPDTVLSKQIKESENMEPIPLDDVEIHPEAIYISRCLTEL